MHVQPIVLPRPLLLVLPNAIKPPLHPSTWVTIKAEILDLDDSRIGMGECISNLFHPLKRIPMLRFNFIIDPITSLTQFLCCLSAVCIFFQSNNDAFENAPTIMNKQMPVSHPKLLSNAATLLVR